MFKNTVIYLYGSGFGSLHKEAKNEEIIDFFCFVTFLRLLSLKNDVNIPSKWNKHKKFKKKKELIFCWHLKGHWRKEQDPDRDPGPFSKVQIRNPVYQGVIASSWLFRQEVSHWRAVAGGERPPARRHQHAARDPAADAPDRPQHHHVRGLSQSVVHVPPPPRAHPAQRGVLPEPSRPDRHVPAAGQARAHDVLVRQSHGGNRTEFVDQESWQVRLIIFLDDFSVFRIRDKCFFDPRIRIAW